MKAIIIGATSGIGLELTKELAKEGWQVGITGRRVNILQDLQKAIGNNIHIAKMDVSHFDDARETLSQLIEEMGGMDVLILNAGIGSFTRTWDKEKAIIDINATGFAALANIGYKYFEEQGGGQIVGISSIAAERGSSFIPVYNATKAFISSYMEGLRTHAQKKKNGITITDIRPGFVETPMTEQNGDNMFWVATANKAAKQIITAMKRKKKVAYITKRWWLVAKLLKVLPDFVYSRMA